MGKLKELAGMKALEAIEDVQDENRKNRIAESQFARRTLWGEKKDANTETDEIADDNGLGDTMRQTILGDQKTTTYVTNQSSLGKALIGAGLIATGLSGAVGAYFIADAIKNKPAQVINEVYPSVTEDTDTIINWSLE